MQSDKLSPRQNAPKQQQLAKVSVSEAKPNADLINSSMNTSQVSNTSLGRSSLGKDKAYFLERMRQAKTGQMLDKLLDESKLSTSMRASQHGDLSGI